MIQCELDFGISEDGFQNSGQKEHFEFQNESQQETKIQMKKNSPIAQETAVENNKTIRSLHTCVFTYINIKRCDEMQNRHRKQKIQTKPTTKRL